MMVYVYGGVFIRRPGVKDKKKKLFWWDTRDKILGVKYSRDIRSVTMTNKTLKIFFFIYVF